MPEKGLREILDWIAARDDIALVAHVSPDGDAIGSTLALKALLAWLGKRACVVCQDAVPPLYRFLPGAETVCAPEGMPFQPQCLLLVDISSPDRAGARLEEYWRAGLDAACLDHHASNAGFCAPCYVDGAAAATGVLAMRLLDLAGMPLSREQAILLYAAISTDTGNFSYQNTDAEAFACARRCLEAGLPLAAVNKRLFRLRSVARTRLLGALLSRIEFFHDGEIALARATQALFTAFGAGRPDTDGAINFLIEMEGVRVAMLLEERGPDTKCSLRSDGSVDLARIAAALGGGGHEAAAGTTFVNTGMDAAVERLLRAMEAAL